MKKILVTIMIFSSMLLAFSQKNTEITKKELKEYISFLASDSLKGRKPGTPEGVVAANYIGDYFKSLGYKSFGKSYYQYFDVVTEVTAGNENYLKIGAYNATVGKDYTPLNYSTNAKVDAEVVFVGFGFDISEDKLKWNDYANIDVKGKLVLMLRADPELDNPDSKFIPYVNERSKVLTAKEKGAIGVLFVSGLQFDKRDKLMKLVADQTESNLGIPALHIKRAVANKILAKSGKTIEGLETSLNKNKNPESFNSKTNVSILSKVNFKKVKTQNVVGYIKGSDKKLRNEYIVIGGHYDHLGFGGPASSSRMPDSIAVHFGADDNASGIASIMEIAEKLAKNKKKLKRSVIVMAFGAEEIGLIGSKYFTSNPTVELKKIKAMINVDMVGRLKESKELFVGGVGTATESEDLLNSMLGKKDMKLGISYNGFGPSDHAAFYIENIPVFFFSTGAHADYHTPLDVIEMINFDGLKLLTDYIYELSVNIINRNKNLSFKESGPKGKAKPSRGSKVKLGIMPNFGKSDNKGLRIDAVTPEGPAYNGGIKKGDVITAIEGGKIHNIYEYMARMGKLKPGQTITIDLLRDSKKIVLIIQLED
ncbi:MAG: hypothetical protein B6I20_14275 [Bacteroidetes bacterium 4572_117]|nr:MAG: hypothetical protein B6I20_14275 [Bacteroidetes bacterium 4572_117]